MAGGSSSAPPKPGLVFWGRVSSVVSATQFTCDILRGKGDTFFVLWYLFVVKKANSTTTSPFHEKDACLAYISSTGLFTISGTLLANLAIGDEIYLLHPDIGGGNIAGLIVYSGHSTPNWNSGVATSGAAGADLTTIGVVGGDYIVHSLLISIANLTAGANITIRLYTDISGTERQSYNQTFVQGTNPDGLWIINGSLGLSSPMRIEVYSDNPLDDGAMIEYEYMRQP